MLTSRIVDVVDEATFALLPPCADPSFDHRTCDYWEDPARGSKAHRPGWLTPVARPSGPSLGASGGPANPFAPDPARPPTLNPFDPRAERSGTATPLALEDDSLDDNPFAPRRAARPSVGTDVPRKLALLGRGLAVFGSYAKVLLVDDRPAAYAQFGPLSAYPRALHVRDLYPQLPASPLPAVITCIATTRQARGYGHALRLVEEVCRDLAARGFSAVEAYPEATTSADATSAASPRFWERAGFDLRVPDERFPVMRRELR